MAEMEYTQPKKVKRHRCGWRNFCRMLMYKPPTQSQAKHMIEKHLRKEKEKDI
jgi:hypothetical protein